MIVDSAKEKSKEDFTQLSAIINEIKTEMENTERKIQINGGNIDNFILPTL